MQEFPSLKASTIGEVLHQLDEFDCEWLIEKHSNAIENLLYSLVIVTFQMIPMESSKILYDKGYDWIFLAREDKACDFIAHYPWRCKAYEPESGVNLDDSWIQFARAIIKKYPDRDKLKAAIFINVDTNTYTNDWIDGWYTRLVIDHFVQIKV